LRPLFKSTIRGAYKLTEKTREAFAEAQEQVQDMMAEARHEGQEEAVSSKAVTEVHPPVKA
jgi:F0F1-type ATP synthase membrane subunit b/b'